MSPANAKTDVPARDPFVLKVVVVVLAVAFGALLATLAVLGAGVLLAAFAGLLLAIVLSAFAGVVAERTPLPYAWALTLVVVLLLGVLGAATWLLGSQIAAEADEFSRMVPQVAADVESFLQQYAWGQWLLEQANGGGGGGNGGDEDSGGGTGSTAALAALGKLSDFFTYLLVAVFVGLFAAAKPQFYVDGVVSLTPIRHRDRMRELLGELGHTLRWWLIGQGAAMVLIGVSTALVLWAFGIRLAAVVGLIVGLLGFIPYLGPIVGVLPVAMVAGTEGATTLLWVLLAYTAVQMLEGYVATPLILERTVYLPPVFTIILQILLGVVLGVKGIVMATPVAAVILVLSRFYRRDFLGDRTVDVRAS
jgi:predicted PurR-regulated permease PerM